MTNKHKAKTAGKIIIIVLSLAILFFLLLPFLDSPAASGGAGGKKAVPQIFTSNPLSDLVQKVFAMFKRDSQKAPSYSDGMTEEMLASLSPEEQQKYALQRAEEEGKNFEYSTEVDASYAYGEAGMVNENGEWILVRQTVPESANLGMHEINTRESAYDRHVRQERAARYTGKAGADAGPAIPDSKWARLWKPIKTFFTGEDEADTVQEATGEKAYLLASAGSGLGHGKTANDGSRSSNRNSTNPSPFNISYNGGRTLTLAEIIDPESTLNETRDNILKEAKKMLTPQQYNKFETKMKLLTQEQIDNIRQQLTNDIFAEAEGKTPEDLILQTFNLCNKTGSSGFYQSNPEEGSCGAGISNKEELKEENFKKIKEALGDKVPIKESPNMIVVMGKAGVFDPAKLSDTPENKVMLQYYQQLLQQNKCDEQNCVWVARNSSFNDVDPFLADTIEASGFDFIGASSNIDISLTHSIDDLMIGFSLNDDLNMQSLDLDMDISLAEMELEKIEKNIREVQEYERQLAENPPTPQYDENGILIPFIDTNAPLQEYTEEDQLKTLQRIDQLRAQKAQAESEIEERERFYREMQKSYYPLPEEDWRKLISGETPKDRPFILADSTVMAQLLRENLVDNPYRLLTDPNKTLLDLSGSPTPENINQRVLDNIRKKQTLIHNAQQGITQAGTEEVVGMAMENVKEDIQKNGDDAIEML